MYLSKSDFKVAQTCPTKLYYKKRGYPSVKDDDEYLALLAEGGSIVQKIATYGAQIN
jgi:CRISPR/Cas system-associated exonuclease Cas4 (RecB family)